MINVKKRERILILSLLLTLILSLFFHSFVFSAPPSSPYYPGETLDPACSPGDTNCTVAPPLPTYISTTTIVQLNNNLLSFNTGTVKILGILDVLGTTTFNGVSYNWPTNPPLPNQFLQADGAGNLQWADVTLSTAGGWTDEGNLVRLQTITDSVAIGTTTKIGQFIISHPNNPYAFVVDDNGNIAFGTTSVDVNAATGVFLQSINESGGEWGTIIFEKDADINLRSFSNISSDVAGLAIGKARGTYYSPSYVTAGHRLGGIFFEGYDGATNSFKTSAAIIAWAAQDWIGSGRGTYLTFETVATGTSSRIERMRIDAYGNIGIGTTTPIEKLTVQGNILGVGNLNITGTTTLNTTTISFLTLNTPLSISSGGTGLTTIGSANQILGVKSDASGLEYKNISSLLQAGSGISISGTSIATISNTGILSLTAGQGISITPGQNPTITNLGVLSLNNATGTLTLQGTPNQVNVTTVGNTITLSTPQDIATSSSPTFAGLTLSNLTSGSVLFVGIGGVINQDNSNLYWDNTNKRLGIGTSTPEYTLDLVGTLRAGNVTLSGGSLIWWVNSNPSSDWDVAYSVAVDSTGIYVVGWDMSPGNFNGE